MTSAIFLVKFFLKAAEKRFAFYPVRSCTMTAFRFCGIIYCMSLYQTSYSCIFVRPAIEITRFQLLQGPFALQLSVGAGHRQYSFEFAKFYIWTLFISKKILSVLETIHVPHSLLRRKIATEVREQMRQNFKTVLKIIALQIVLRFWALSRFSVSKHFWSMPRRLLT